jgi:hypothetical protein
MRANPAVVRGAPRSEVKTNGDFGSLIALEPSQGTQFVPRGSGALQEYPA